MENPFKQALHKVTSFLETQTIQYAVIGGIANQIWGQARFTIVDFLLSTPGYEEQLVKRAIRHKFDKLSLWICTAEDLIIQKAIAGRSKDWQDIEGIVIEQKTNLDQRYLEDWLGQFAEALDNPNIFDQFRTIWQRVMKPN